MAALLRREAIRGPDNSAPSPLILVDKAPKGSLSSRKYSTFFAIFINKTADSGDAILVVLLSEICKWQTPSMFRRDLLSRECNLIWTTWSPSMPRGLLILPSLQTKGNEAEGLRRSPGIAHPPQLRTKSHSPQRDDNSINLLLTSPGSVSFQLGGAISAANCTHLHTSHAL